MDAIISSALGEICAQGRDGLALSSLCSKLGLTLQLKRALWTNLLTVPTLHFRSLNRVYDPNDPSIRRFDDAEKLDLIIVAKDKFFDNFLGIYDFSLGGSDEKDLHLILERIASARTNGVTQSQLGKEFGLEGNRIFYPIKKLEKRGLIVKQEAVERTRGPGHQGQSTRLIHLYRFAKHLGSQQKFEITREEETTTNRNSNIHHHHHVKDDVLVKDYVPSMKAVCDKLEAANSKVLVISDMKRDLGYTGSRSKLRYWRTICDRLKNAGVVEETYVKVNGKDECCLHLLKQFSKMDFEQKPSRYVEGKELKWGRCQTTNQLVELPIDHQIYDAIDEAGSQGMLINEVSQRFGLDNKANFRNCCIMSKKFGMPMQRELHNKASEYRIRTARNCKSSNVVPRGSKDLISKNSSLNVASTGFSDGAKNLHLLNSECDTLEKTNSEETAIELSCFSPGHSEASHNISNACQSQELIHESRIVSSDTGLNVMNSALMTRKPCQSLTVDSTRRENRILELLQVEKILLKAELYKWLVNLEKDKSTMMCRKTVDRILFKLENQGQCKCICIAVHEIMNTQCNREVKVVLHPSIQSSSLEVLGRIRNKIMSFEKHTHGQASFRKKHINSVLLLDGIQRTHAQESTNTLALRMEAMRANGFISGKMIRAKLLHSFLWDYSRNSSARNDVLSYGRQDQDLQSPYVTHNLFYLEAAIKGMPLKLFLQVVGSSVKVDNIIEKFKKGVCLCDLSVQEYNDLNDTPAIRRLSSIVSILQRLKLIRLVKNGSADHGVIVPRAGPVYALELKAYIDEPPSTYSNVGSFEGLNRGAVHESIKHEFILSNMDAVDGYWHVLKHVYVAADTKAASQVFPGSMVQEIFGRKSWALGQGTSAAQHAKVLKLIAKRNLNQKLPYKEYKEVAKNLNLIQQDNSNAMGAECQPKQSCSFSRKRKRLAEDIALKHTMVEEIGSLCRCSLPGSADADKGVMVEGNLMLASSCEHETELQEHQEEDQWKTSEEPGGTRDRFSEEKINVALEEFLWGRHVPAPQAPRKPGDICNSQFPSQTGRSAAKFSRWLCEREKDFKRGGIDLTVDLQCGEIFHLFALVSSGELLISPSLPVEGVGEGEYTRSLKHTSLFSEISDCRREKGFPGIKLTVHRAPKPRAVALESSFKNGEKCANEHFVDENCLDSISESLEAGCNLSHNLRFGRTVSEPGDSCETPWELMVGYATDLMPLPPNQEHVGILSTEVFKAVYSAIHNAGNQGLAIREVSRVMDSLGEKMAELVIDVLQKYGQVQKVRINGSIRVIAGSTKKPSSIHIDENGVQKVTVLNHHWDFGPLLDETPTSNLHEDSIQGCKHYDANGITTKNKHNRIITQTYRIVMQNPGILEDDIIRKMELPNPQRCKKLLRLMVGENHLIVKKKHQRTPNAVPAILGTLIRSNNFKKSISIYREHFFANPASTYLL